MKLCDWINSHFSWLADAVVSIGFKGQLVLGVAIIISITICYVLIENRKHIADLMSDDEPYAKWMDYDRWLDTKPERKKHR